MPIIDLNSPTQLLFEWGWLLVTRANALVYALLVLVFLLGAFVSLPDGSAGTPAPPPRGGPAPAEDAGEGA